MVASASTADRKQRSIFAAIIEAPRLDLHPLFIEAETTVDYRGFGARIVPLTGSGNDKSCSVRAKGD
jgi:hypothetical protein